MRYAMGDSRIKDVSSLLSAFFDEGKIRKGERYADFFASWLSIVGERLAAHSRVADVDKGLLVVEAEHPGWIQLLQLQQSRILAEVSRRYPELEFRGIVFRLAGRPLGARPPEAAPPPPMKPKSEAEVAEGIAEDEKAWREQGERAPRTPDDPAFAALFSSLRDAMKDRD
jgi:hypothetical protein